MKKTISAKITMDVNDIQEAIRDWVLKVANSEVKNWRPVIREHYTSEMDRYGTSILSEIEVELNLDRT